MISLVSQTANILITASGQERTITIKSLPDISFLTKSSIDRTEFCAKMADLTEYLTDLIYKGQNDRYTINTAEINYLNKLFDLAKTKPFMDNIQRIFSPSLKNIDTLFADHKDLQNIAIFLDTSAEVISFYFDELNHSSIMFRREQEHSFKDFIRDTLWLKEFHVQTVQEYYTLPEQKIYNFFKKIPEKKLPQILFWFTYSRLHWEFKATDPSPQKIFNYREGDCTDLTLLNSMILKNLNKQFQPAKIKIKNISHVFIILNTADSQWIIDSQNIGEFPKNINIEDRYKYFFKSMEVFSVEKFDIENFLNTGVVK